MEALYIKYFQENTTTNFLLNHIYCKNENMASVKKVLGLRI